MKAFLIPFAAIFLAEFGDKTMLATLMMASRTRKHAALFFGVLLAFAVVDGAAILLGAAAPNILPVRAVKIVSGILFIVGGVLMFINPESEEKEVEESKMIHPFWAGFWVVFAAEWGDKTQIAAGLFASRFPPLQVFLGAMLALGALAAIAVFAGRFIAGKISRSRLEKIASVIFVVMGIAFLLT